MRFILSLNKIDKVKELKHFKEKMHVFNLLKSYKIE